MAHYLINFITTISGAFAGSGAAFLLNYKYVAYQNKMDHKVSLNKANYVVERTQKLFEEINRRINEYDPYEDSDMYSWEKITEIDCPSLPLLDTTKLMLLLDYEKEGSNFLNSIFLVSIGSQDAMGTLTRRNQYYDSYLTKTEKRESLKKDELITHIGEKIITG